MNIFPNRNVIYEKQIFFCPQYFIIWVHPARSPHGYSGNA